jgi:CheY-like chemotaxis protein
MWPFNKWSLDDLELNLSREELRRRCRILIVDDERIDLIDDLRQAGFSIDYEPDVTVENQHKLEQALYDLLLLDFGNVGKSFGENEGLSVLRHVKRVNPALIVVAYTSKFLGSDHADFYRLSDFVLSKDAGIKDSQEKIEKALRKAQSLENLWEGLRRVAGITPGSSLDKRLQHKFVKGAQKPGKMEKFKQSVTERVGSEAGQQAASITIQKLIELGITAVVSA